MPTIVFFPTGRRSEIIEVCGAYYGTVTFPLISLIPAGKSMRAAGYSVGYGTNFSFLLILGQYCRNRFPANFQP